MLADQLPEHCPQLGDESADEKTMKVATIAAKTDKVGDIVWCADGTPKDENLYLKTASQELAQRYEGPSEFWTNSTLPAMSVNEDASMSSLPSMVATKDTLPLMNATKDSLPSMFVTKESLPSMHPTRDVLAFISSQGTSVSVSEDVSESENDWVPRKFPANADLSTMKELADGNSMISAKAAWQKRRAAKKAERQAQKRPSYGDLLRTKMEDKKNTAVRPPSPGAPKRHPKDEEVDECMPRLIMQGESLPTIMSVSCETTATNSKVSSKINSQQGSILGSHCHSRPMSRSHTLDSLPEFGMDMISHSRLMTRTTTRDSLPPIGDATESESGSDSESSESEETDVMSARDRAMNDGGFPEGENDSNALRAALKASYEQIAALQSEIDELKHRNTVLKRENYVLKALATQTEPLTRLPSKPSRKSGDAGSGGGYAGNPLADATEQWLKRREERRARLRSEEGKRTSYGGWLQAQYEQAPLACN